MPRSTAPKSQKILDFFEESSLELAEEILSLCAAKIRQRRHEGGHSPAAVQPKTTRQYRKKKKQPETPAPATE
jgi:hypothetical protein